MTERVRSECRALVTDEIHSIAEVNGEKCIRCDGLLLQKTLRFLPNVIRIDEMLDQRNVPFQC